MRRSRVSRRVPLGCRAINHVASVLSALRCDIHGRPVMLIKVILTNSAAVTGMDVELQGCCQESLDNAETALQIGREVSRQLPRIPT